MGGGGRGGGGEHYICGGREGVTEAHTRACLSWSHGSALGISLPEKADKKQNEKEEKEGIDAGYLCEESRAEVGTVLACDLSRPCHKALYQSHQ